jgi:hypothetical protein
MYLNAKMITAETIAAKTGRKNKGEQWKDRIQV